MKKTIQVLSIVFTIIAIGFSILPLDTIGILPIALALAFALINIKLSDQKSKKLAKIIFFSTLIILLIYIGRQVFIKDSIEKDTKFEQQKIESKQEAKKALEGLE